MMNIVWKALVGIFLAIAILCIVRVAMFGVDSLPFMNAFSSGPRKTTSGARQSVPANIPTGAPATAATNYAQTQSSAPAAPQRAASQPAGMPNPPTIYDRARRAGNRPNQGTDE